MTRPVRNVVVVGGGTAAWMCAIALHRAFARTGLDVSVVEVPGDPPVGAISTLPDLVRFHRILGITEPDLLAQADATFALGQEFVGWSGGGGGFLHGYGETGRPIAELPFLQLWSRARAGGLRLPFEAFNLTAAAARHGRMPPHGGKGPALTYGYHLDAGRYAALLRRHAVALGIAVRPAATVRVEPAATGIAMLHLPDGERLAADLYVDATGHDALLAGAPDEDSDDAASPVTRMLSGWAPPLDPLPLYARITAHRDGWIGLFPLATRTGVVMAYGDTLSDDAAREALPRRAAVRIDGELRTVPIGHRLRRRPWVGNCVAIGAAACEGDPIDSATLQREQIAIAQLVALFPVDRDAMPEAAIYNDEVVAHHRRLNDFQAAQYRLNGRVREPFWDAARARPVSTDLAWKIALFEARGMVAEYNHESFQADSWQAILLGHGLTPRSHDPQADAVPEGQVAQQLQAMLADIRRDVDAMVPHATARARALAAR